MTARETGAQDPVAELLHYYEQAALPKAFAVPFADLGTWSVGGFYAIDWSWPSGDVRPLGDALDRRQEAADPEDGRGLLTIRFDGTIEQREGDADLKGRLYATDPGDLVYSKIDVRHGAIGVVPDDVGPAAVTAEYPVYRVRPEVASTAYVRLVVRLGALRRLIDGMIAGASGRKRVNPEQLEAVEVPLPDPAVQDRIVAAWRASRDEAAALEREADAAEDRVSQTVYDLLGMTPQDLGPVLPRVMAVPSADLGRWTFFHVARKRAGLTGFQTSAYPIRTLGEEGVETANGRSIKPTTQDTPYRVLKLSALTPAGFDATESKPVLTKPDIAERFSVMRDDLLMCRSIGSFDQIAKCAVVAETDPTLLYPDIMIRVGLPDSLDPRYVREVVQTPVGRSFFQTYARTAVGMWKIGAEDIHDFPIPVPPLEVQTEIVQAVSDLRNDAARLRAEADRVRQRGMAEVELMILGRRPVAP